MKLLVSLATFALMPVAVLAQASPSPIPATSAAIVRDTLSNGMHVVILPDTLAPVVATIVAYGVGSDDDTMPGIAHATEHMLFRGTKDVSAGQLSDIVARAGADENAFTTNELTLFYFKMPSAYLPIALHLEADRMTGATIGAVQWNDERPAIEAEIRGQQSKPSYVIGQKLRGLIFADTPLANASGGTIPSFEKMTAGDIRAFYHHWYGPGNATLVIAGAVDPERALEQVHAAFDAVAPVPVPERSPFTLQPLAAATLTDSIDFPIGFSALLYRLPGTNDPDFAASRVLGGVLQSQRNALADLALQGKALGTLALDAAFPEAGAEFIVGLPAPGEKLEDVRDAMRGVLAGYRSTGVPEDLVDSAKRRLVAERAYDSASISGLAIAWAQSIGTLRSPGDQLAALQAVTPDDVDRVLRSATDPSREVVAAIRANPTTTQTHTDPNAGAESVAYTPSVHLPQPAWVTPLFAAPLAVPDASHTVGSTLANGIRLAVRRETASPTIELRGVIRSDDQLYERKGKEGASVLADSLLPFGTATYDRKGYQTELDSIAATAHLGREFSLRVGAADFDRGVALLADGLLHPAFAADSFAIVRGQYAQSIDVSEKLPSTKAKVERDRAMYPAGDPHRRRATPASVAALTLSDVQNAYRFNFRPDLTSIALVGDIDPVVARATIEKYFGAWKATGRAPSFEYPDVPQTKASRDSTIVVKAQAQEDADVTLTQKLPVYRGDRKYIALVLADVMLSGEGFDSLLLSDLRTKRKFVYDADSSLEAVPGGSTLTITYSTETKNVARTNAAIAGILTRLRTADVAPFELQRAKARLIALRALAQDSYANLADGMLEGAKVGDYSDGSRFFSRLRSVTAADVRRAMQLVSPTDFVRTVIAP